MSQRTSILHSAHPESAVTGEIGDATVVRKFEDLETEYSALRDRAGLIDLGGATLIKVSGPAAEDFLQNVLARDVEYLTPERCITSLILDVEGEIVDLVTVWGHDDGAIIESSVGGGARLLEHLGSVEADSVELTDISGAFVVIALEGPYSWGVIGRLIDTELPALPLDSVAETEWDGTEILFARTGATGEYGYKMMVPAEAATNLWNKAAAEATPVGFDVHSLAMLEVRQPVPHHEFGPGTSVLVSGTNWLVDITKEEFLGRDAVLAEFEGAPGRRTVGFSMDGEAPAAGTPILAGDQQIGEIVHAVHSPGLGEALGLARVDAEFAAAGLELTAADHPVQTLSSTYITPKSWTIPIV